MSSSKEIDKFKNLLYDHADSVSYNEETSKNYLKENGVDVDKFVAKGLDQIKSTLRKKESQKIKALFFKRVVLGAEIVYNLHKERTFGHVKLMKLMYLCEQVSNMEISTRYVKQAAGPFDARFMHSIDKEFRRLKWFNVNVNTEKNFTTYEYIPDVNVLSYKSYFSKYYSYNKEPIAWLIKTFGKPQTKKVELVATIYSCLDELIKNKEELSNDILVERVFDWSKEKRKKFTKDDITNAHNWMIDNRLIPLS